MEQRRPVKPGTPWQRLGAGMLAVHGIAHLVGTTDAFRAINDNTSLSYLFGRWEITNTLVLGTAATLWAIVATGFAIGVIAVWFDATWRRTTVGGTVVVSTALCVIALPQTFIGLIVDAALLAVAVGARPTRHERSR